MEQNEFKEISENIRKSIIGMLEYSAKQNFERFWNNVEFFKKLNEEKLSKNH